MTVPITSIATANFQPSPVNALLPMACQLCIAAAAVAVIAVAVTALTVHIIYTSFIF